MDRDGLKCYAKIEIQIKEVHPHFHCKSCGTSIRYHLNLKSLSIKIIMYLKLCIWGVQQNVFNTAIKIVLVKI